MFFINMTFLQVILHHMFITSRIIISFYLYRLDLVRYSRKLDSTVLYVICSPGIESLDPLMEIKKPKYTKVLHQGTSKHKFFSKKSFPDKGKLPTKRQVIARFLCRRQVLPFESIKRCRKRIDSTLAVM